MPANPPSDNDVDESESSLVWGTSTFEPGYDVGLVSRLTVGVIERDNPSTRERLWSLVADDAPLDDILDELSSTGLKALPDFGVAQVEGDRVRIVARGRTTVTAELASGESHEIDPSGVRTWIEEVVADVVGLTVSLAPLDDDPDVPLSSEAFAVLAGSIPARSLSRRFDVVDRLAEQVSPEWNAGGATPPADVADLQPAPEVELEMVDADADEPAAGDLSYEDAAAAPEPGIVPPQPADPQPPGPPPADPQPASPQPSGPPPASPQPPGPPADPQPASPQPSGPPPSGPGAGGAPPEPTVVVGPDDGPARGPVSSIFDDDVAEPVVPSLPPDGRDAGFGGIDDGVADAGDPAASVAAEVFGVLAFSNGERINVDRAVLIGRNPKVAGAVEGGLPHIMKFDGPGQGLSRTHAEVRVENGEMVLEDLQSTNGTEIQLPGQQRRRLRGGEPVVVVPGTLIDFGDELHCTVETAS